MDNGLFWEQLDNEPKTAYHAFCMYRDMGITRSLRKAAKAFYAERDGHREDPTGTPNAASLRRFKEWSRTHMWQARVEAYDAEEQRERSLRMRERRIKAAEFHFNLAQLAFQRVAERLQNLALTGEELPPKSLAQISNAAVTLYRLALSEPTANVEIQGTVRPQREDDASSLDGLSVEDKEELARIAGYLRYEDFSLDDTPV